MSFNTSATSSSASWNLPLFTTVSNTTSFSPSVNEKWHVEWDSFLKEFLKLTTDPGRIISYQMMREFNPNQIPKVKIIIEYYPIDTTKRRGV